MMQRQAQQAQQRQQHPQQLQQRRFGENMGQLLDQNHASSLLKSSAVAAGQPSGQVLCRLLFKPGINNFQDPHQILRLDMNSVLNTRFVGAEGSLIGIPGC